ncbi:ABC transporter six-transmembrane domain-containing protein [uncultured Enterovirga sp.]|uniref:ABC transporter six-transmembrane domain-containing protein n=1 Tax=uncultured Enterovirga sp. TaxID=2026352 RepID=UPI0035C99B4F
MASPSPRPLSALEAVRPFRPRIALTYGLIFLEDLLELSYPWATGLAIDGLIAHQYVYILPIVVAWTLRGAIGCFRQMYDTRLYTVVYNNIVTATITRQRSAGVRTSDVAARSSMSRDFVTFFEKDVPTILTSLVGIVGSAVILFFYDMTIGAITASLFLPVYLINRGYSRRSAMLNAKLNDQLEHEVDLIEENDEQRINQHFTLLRQWRIKLSDAAAINWTIIEVLSIIVFMAVIARATFLPTTETGDIFAILVYVWRLMENLDHIPEIVQQLTRLQDIRKRIEAGASIEAVGAEIEKAHEQDASEM